MKYGKNWLVLKTKTVWSNTQYLHWIDDVDGFVAFMHSDLFRDSLNTGLLLYVVCWIGMLMLYRVKRKMSRWASKQIWSSGILIRTLVTIKIPSSYSQIAIDQPSKSPSKSPSTSPSRQPSASPSKSPSTSPSASPSKSSSVSSSKSPSGSLSKQPLNLYYFQAFLSLALGYYFRSDLTYGL